jgi:hypothetical protein
MTIVQTSEIIVKVIVEKEGKDLKVQRRERKERE